MNVVAAVVIAVIALAIVGIVFYAIRSAGQAASARADAPTGAPPRPMPQVSDFHVKGDTARTVFAVPLGDTEPGEHLVELLSAAAVEHIGGRTSLAYELQSELAASLDPHAVCRPERIDDILTEASRHREQVQQPWTESQRVSRRRVGNRVLSITLVEVVTISAIPTKKLVVAHPTIKMIVATPAV